MNKTISKPSPWWYAAGAAVIVLSLVAFLVYVGISSNVDSSTRVVVPGTHEMDLHARGKYTVFYEYRSVVDGHQYSTGDYLPPVSASLTAKETSEPVQLSRPSTNSSYSTNNYDGRSELEFWIDEPGTYVFTCDYDEGYAGQDVVFAISQTSVKKTVIVGFLIGAGGFSIGMLIIVITLARYVMAGGRTQDRPGTKMPSVAGKG